VYVVVNRVYVGSHVKIGSIRICGTSGFVLPKKTKILLRRAMLGRIRLHRAKLMYTFIIK
jgi:hypothetical protein